MRTDVRTVPSPLGPGSAPLRTDAIAASDWIFYDLETGGFGLDSTVILQLSAACGNKTFDCYVDPPPNYVIPEAASAVNQLRVLNGRLTYKNQLVQSKTHTGSILAFHWLAGAVQSSNPNGPQDFYF